MINQLQKAGEAVQKLKIAFPEEKFDHNSILKLIETRDVEMQNNNQFLSGDISFEQFAKMQNELFNNLKSENSPRKEIHIQEEAQELSTSTIEQIISKTNEEHFELSERKFDQLSRSIKNIKFEIILDDESVSDVINRIGIREGRY